MDLGPFELESHLSWKYAEEMLDISEPLFAKLQINYVDYAHYYFDGRVMGLYTDRRYVKYFIQNNFNNSAPNVVIEPGYHLWAEYIEQPYLQIVAEKFNHANGLTILFENNSYKEVFNIATAPNHNSILSLYLNHKNIIEEIINYIRSKTKKLIHKLEDRPLILRPTLIEKPKQSKLNIFTELDNLFDSSKPHTNDNKPSIKFGDRSISLTKREAQSLYLLYIGNTSKEIAKKLSISHRTIEMYLDNVRFKTDSKNRFALLSKLRDCDLSELASVFTSNN